MIITCHGRTFNVHRSILCLQSKFIRRELKPKTKYVHPRLRRQRAAAGLPNIEEQEQKQKQKLQTTNNVDVYFHDHPEIIERVISHIYTQDYQANAGRDHVHVYSAARYFELHKVKEHASKKYKIWADEHWQSPEFVQSVKDMLMVTVNGRGKVLPRGILMDAVVEAVTEHIVDLIKDGAILHVLSGRLAVPVLARLIVTRFPKMTNHTRP